MKASLWFKSGRGGLEPGQEWQLACPPLGGQAGLTAALAQKLERFFRARLV